MQPIAQDLANFAELREKQCIYVDKTEQLYRLVQGMALGAKLFFLSRPRRFGKTLLLSTLKCLFQGRRDLFKGLAIDALDYDWQPHPVLHFDFATLAIDAVATFERGFVERVTQSLNAAGLDYNPAMTPGGNFATAIRTLAKEAGRPVVILIDEYDSPVSHALDDIPKANAIRDRLSAFYGEIKNNAADIRFMLMTGLTKFTQHSVFSALNNLTDLTLDALAADLLGYTERELDACFGDYLRAHAKAMALPDADYRAQLQWWYNGYRFSPDSETKVYNPVAIGRALARRKPYFEPTWSETGHSSALMRYLAAHPLTARDYERIPELTRNIFDTYDLANIRDLTFLYQAGYLTIKDFNPIEGYTLGIPDEDVRQDLNQILVDQALQGDDTLGWNTIRVALLKHDFPAFFAGLKAFYARLTYGPKEGRVPEASYQRSLFILLTAGGLRVVSEDTQAQGRADLVADAFGRVFVFELKLGGTAQDALAQIRDRRYNLPYLTSAQSLHRIGLAFDPETRQLVDAAAEPAQP